VQKPCRDLLGRRARRAVEQLDRPITGRVERRTDQLVLAPWKMVIDRAARRTGMLEDLRE